MVPSLVNEIITNKTWALNDTIENKTFLLISIQVYIESNN